MDSFQYFITDCNYVYRPQTKLRKGNVFTSVCQEFCPHRRGYICHGMTESVKVHRKDWSVKDFTLKCLFLLFWPISCVSLIFLIEIRSFCTNLLENYPAHKIDQLPLFRILSLCKDQQFVITGLYTYSFLCACIKHRCIVSQCLVA